MRRAIPTTSAFLVLVLVLGAACGDAEPEVMTTDTGLQYQVLSEGEGPSPTMQDQVVVHYRGTLADGTQFDSSHDRGEPSTFYVSHMIPTGFAQALLLMSAGSHFRVTIPPELGYGEAGLGDLIGPNQTLIFEIELLEIIGG